MAQAENSGKSGRRLSPLAVRFISAAVITPPVLIACWLGGLWFNALCAVLFAATLCEWRGLCWQAAKAGKIRFIPWFAPGGVYAASACVMLIFIRADEGGRETALWLLTAVWTADICAYFTGRGFGGPKLAPKISPNKTWAGFFGAVVGAALCGWTAALLLGGGFNVIHAALFGAALGAVSQGGDLIESWAKRRFGAKDSGRMMPGHGGLLDRVDGLMAAVVFVFVLNSVWKGPLQL